MSVVRNLSLAVKLAVLVALGAVLAVAVTLVGQQALARVDTESRTMATDVGGQAIDLAPVWNFTTRERARLMLTALLASDPVENAKSLKKLEGNRADMLASLEEYKKGPMSPAQRAVLDGKVVPAVAAFHAQLDKMIPLIDHDPTAAEKQKFQTMLADELNPLTDDLTASFTAMNETNKKALLASSGRVHAEYTSSTITLWVFTAVGVLMLGALGLTIGRLVSRSVARVTAAVEALGDGDLTVDSGVTGTDEMGRMAQSLRDAQGRLRETILTLSDTSTTLAGSAEELTAVSTQVAFSSQSTADQSVVASDAAGQVSYNVQTVAAATEEMTSSIREISSSSADAVRVAQAAMSEADAAVTTITNLGESSQQIGNVIKVITSIAEQTNLLALNATIEAARAGTAGKGFAVVAEEVKQLAQETSRATSDISARVEAIQGDTDAAVAAIQRISEVIEEINQYQTTIASAVEEQTATTGEMARSVQEAAQGSTDIAATIASVATAAASATTGVTESQRAAEELASLSGTLRELVSRFKA